MKITKRGCSFCTGFLAIVTVVLVFFGPKLIDQAINEEIPAKAMMTTQNYQTWGEVPGGLNVTALIKFTFFNFTNPFDVLYLNKTPEFVETKPYVYQNFQKFLKANFSTDENGTEYVEFNPYLWYEPYGDVDDQDLVTVPNLGPLITWYSMKHSTQAKICMEALNNLADGFETSLGLGVTSQSVFAGFIQGKQDQIYQLIFEKANIDQATFDYIWSDAQYGWNQPGTFQTWIQASHEGVDNATSRLLMEYFYLSFEQMSVILNGELKKYMAAMDSNVANMFNCSEVPCNSKYLGYLQWAQQGVTLHLPGNNSKPSIFATGNITLSGYPEISYYLKDYFPKTVSDDPEYQKVTFSVPLALRLFNRSNILHHPLTDWDILIHIGNLEFLFSVGEEYKKTGNLSTFQPMMDRFGLDSLHQSHVLFSYLEYFTSNFSTRRDQGGTPELITGGGKIASIAYYSFIDLQEFLSLQLTSLTIVRNLTNQNITCEAMIDGSVNVDPKSTSAQLCKSLNITTLEESLDSVKQLVQSCWAQEGDSWDFLINKSALTNSNLQSMCYAPNAIFAQALRSAEISLYKHYNCTTLNKRCNKYQLAVMQWSNSSVTSNVPEILKNDLKSSFSVADWDNKTFSKPVEWKPVLNFLKEVFEGKEAVGLSYDEALHLLNFDHIFNGLQLQNIFLMLRNDQMENITKIYNVSDPWPLIYYLRYMMTEIGFVGMTQTRTVKELLWGYFDPFLADVSFGDPVMQGGDPSIRSVISLIPNSTEEKAMNMTESLYTGASNIDDVRRYRTLNGFGHITSVMEKFNGNNTYTDYVNPWTEEAPLMGSDGAQNPPQMNDTAPLYVYNGAMYKVMKCHWEQNATVEKNGMSARRYRIDSDWLKNKTNNPENAAYHIDKWDGIINLTSVQGAPIFLSKLHYLDTDPRLQDSIKMFKDANKTELIMPSSEDDTYFDVEPVTGASFGSALKLQTGFHFEGDSIYPANFEGLFPIFSIQGGGGISDDMVITIFISS